MAKVATVIFLAKYAIHARHLSPFYAYIVYKLYKGQRLPLQYIHSIHTAQRAMVAKRPLVIPQLIIQKCMALLSWL